MLEKGMYVCELDIPWLDSPFIFQGFLITNEEELDQINHCCEFVYIDSLKSQVEIPKSLLIENENQQYEHQPDIENDTPYPVSFEDEFPRAREIFEKVQSHVKAMFKDIRIGRAIRVAEVRSHVKSISDSIMRNPDALLLMTNMKAIDEYMVIHSINVCILSITFGRYLGFDEDDDDLWLDEEY